MLTIAGIVSLVSQTPAGGLIDPAGNKPRIVIVAALLVTVGSLSLPIVSGFTMVAITQSIAAAADAVFAPAISALTLGLVGPKLFAKRVGRNAERWGTKPIFLVAFGFLAARGALYTVSADP